MQLLKDGLIELLAGLARLAAPALARRLSRLAMRLASDLPRLGADWTARFEEPVAPSRIRSNTVEVRLTQFGAKIWGIGHIQGEPRDLFEFEGRIKRNVLYGSFCRKDSHQVAGTGTFVLKVAADGRAMAGQCIWYDSLLDAPWASEYFWTNKSAN